MNTVYKQTISVLVICICVCLVAFTYQQNKKPAIYLIGDSTVDDGSGNKGLWGWGKFLHQFIDTNKVSIFNYAQGGTSARTFYTGGIWDKRINKRGLWDTVKTKLTKGDYLLIQFGLNDQGPVNDSARSRGVIKGTSDSLISIYNYVTKQQETVHSFGWYLEQYILFAKQKKVHVIICSTVPKNVWKEGKLVRGENGFAVWAETMANKHKVPFINLNSLIANEYDSLGETYVTNTFYVTGDNTHTTKPAAIKNAFLVANGVKKINNLPLHKFVNNNTP